MSEQVDRMTRVDRSRTTTEERVSIVANRARESRYAEVGWQTGMLWCDFAADLDVLLARAACADENRASLAALERAVVEAAVKLSESYIPLKALGPGSVPRSEQTVWPSMEAMEAHDAAVVALNHACSALAAARGGEGKQDG